MALSRSTSAEKLYRVHSQPMNGKVLRVDRYAAPPRTTYRTRSRRSPQATSLLGSLFTNLYGPPQGPADHFFSRKLRTRQRSYENQGYPPPSQSYSSEKKSDDKSWDVKTSNHSPSYRQPSRQISSDHQGYSPTKQSFSSGKHFGKMSLDKRTSNRSPSYRPSSRTPLPPRHPPPLPPRQSPSYTLTPDNSLIAPFLMQRNSHELHGHQIPNSRGRRDSGKESHGGIIVHLRGIKINNSDSSESQISHHNFQVPESPESKSSYFSIYNSGSTEAHISTIPQSSFSDTSFGVFHSSTPAHSDIHVPDSIESQNNKLTTSIFDISTAQQVSLFVADSNEYKVEQFQRGNTLVSDHSTKKNPTSFAGFQPPLVTSPLDVLKSSAFRVNLPLEPVDQRAASIEVKPASIKAITGSTGINIYNDLSHINFFGSRKPATKVNSQTPNSHHFISENPLSYFQGVDSEKSHILLSSSTLPKQDSFNNVHINHNNDNIRSVGPVQFANTPFRGSVPFNLGDLRSIISSFVDDRGNVKDFETWKDWVTKEEQAPLREIIQNSGSHINVPPIPNSKNEKRKSRDSSESLTIFGTDNVAEAVQLVMKAVENTDTGEKLFLVRKAMDALSPYE